MVTQLRKATGSAEINAPDLACRCHWLIWKNWYQLYPPQWGGDREWINYLSWVYQGLKPGMWPGLASLYWDLFACSEPHLTVLAAPNPAPLSCNVSPICLASAPVLPPPCPQSRGVTLAPGLVGGEERWNPGHLSFQELPRLGCLNAGHRWVLLLFRLLEPTLGSALQHLPCWQSRGGEPQPAPIPTSRPAAGHCTHHRQTMLRRQGPVTATNSQCHSRTRYATMASSMFPTLQNMLIRIPEKVRCCMSTHSIPARGRQSSAGTHRTSPVRGL